VVIGSAPGQRQLAFQRSEPWVPPRWPDPAYPQQMHLDIRVNDADRAERNLLALGATRVPGNRETGFRVFTDPAGHPLLHRLRPPRRRVTQAPGTRRDEERQAGAGGGVQQQSRAARVADRTVTTTSMPPGVGLVIRRGPEMEVVPLY
jgi:hypothetical protein